LRRQVEDLTFLQKMKNSSFVSLRVKSNYHPVIYVIIENLLPLASSNRIEHSEKESKREMVNGEELSKQPVIGLPFTVYCLPNASGSANCIYPCIAQESQYNR
jgi:hypothetical protein